MNAHTISSSNPQLHDAASAADLPHRPGRGRRTALAVSGFLTCALPVVFTVNVSRMLVTGIEPGHRFHQATGQGLLLFALWLGALVPMIRAGWNGRRPSTATGWLHLAFVGTGIACSAAAPGGGAPILVGVITVTGALLWWALPERPLLTDRFQVDPVLAPLGLALAAFLTPYALDQIALQNATTDPYHVQNPHLFDMAWLAAAVVSLGLLAAVLPAARRLAGWTFGCCLGLGAAGLAFGEGTLWSLALLAFAAAGTAALVLPQRLQH